MSITARKTIEVAGLAAKYQRAILMPTVSTAKREALCWALEALLMDSGNYKGFAYVGGYRPDAEDFDPNLRSYLGVTCDLSGTVLDTPPPSV